MELPFSSIRLDSGKLGLMRFFTFRQDIHSLFFPILQGKLAIHTLSQQLFILEIPAIENIWKRYWFKMFFLY